VTGIDVSHVTGSDVITGSEVISQRFFLTIVVVQNVPLRKPTLPLQWYILYYYYSKKKARGNDVTSGYDVTSGHMTDVTSVHVTNVTSGHVTNVNSGNVTDVTSGYITNVLNDHTFIRRKRTRTENCQCIK